MLNIYILLGWGGGVVGAVFVTGTLPGNNMPKARMNLSKSAMNFSKSGRNTRIVL